MFRNLADNPLLLILLVLIIVLVFGANRLPGAARSLGRSLRIFKSEVKEMQDEHPKRSADPDAGSQAGPTLQGRVVDPDRGTDRADEQHTGRPGRPHDA